MKNWANHRGMRIRELLQRYRHRTVVDVIFDDWFRYGFALDSRHFRVDDWVV